MAKIKEVTELKCKNLSTTCPYCGNEEEWLCDPRGAETECDECGGKYKVHQDADIEYW